MIIQPESDWNNWWCAIMFHKIWWSDFHLTQNLMEHDLVGGLEHLDYFPKQFGNFIIPTDELTPSFFRVLLKNQQPVNDVFPIYRWFPSYKPPLIRDETQWWNLRFFRWGDAVLLGRQRWLWLFRLVVWPQGWWRPGRDKKGMPWWTSMAKKTWDDEDPGHEIAVMYQHVPSGNLT